MRKAVLATLAVACLAAPLAAQERELRQAPARTLPAAPEPQFINLSLMEALISIGAEDLAGIFAYVPEASGAAAFADYLLHNRAALKRFLKKGERDLKELSGINEWDREVAMAMMHLNGAGQLPPGMERLPQGLELRVSALVLSPPLTLADMNARRKP